MSFRLTSGEGYTEHKGVCEVGSRWGQGEVEPMMPLWQRVQMAACFTLIGGAMMWAGLSMMNDSPTVNVTPHTGTTVYTGQDDAASEGRDVPPCDDGLYLAVDGLCYPGKVVRASDGTVTVNVINPDGTVSGTVYTPDGKSFTFGGN